jgi:hypothetical protein
MSGTERDRRAEAARERPDLGRQYHKIGISAVAAALPYSGDKKNGACAPAKPAEDKKRKVVTLGDLDYLML